jgi:hypothetical protein
MTPTGFADTESDVGDNAEDDAIAAAAAQADRIAEQLRSSGGAMEPVYSALDEAIAAVEKQDVDIEDLLPADSEPGLAFFLRQKRDGKTLWEAIAKAARDRICARNSAVRRAFASNAASTTLVTAVIGALGLPLIALPLVATIVGFLLAAGIDGFCTWSAAPADAPS